MTYYKIAEPSVIRPLLEGILAGNVTYEQVADVIVAASGAPRDKVLPALRTQYPTGAALMNFVSTELLVIEKKDVDDLADKIKRGLIRPGSDG